MRGQIDGIWNARGAAQPGVNSTVLRELVVPLPPLDQQRRIAAVLDQADHLRRKRREALRKLGGLSPAVLGHMLLEAESSASVNVLRLKEIVRAGDRINYGVVQPGPESDNGVPLIRVENVVDGAFSRLDLKHISPRIETRYSRSRLHGDEILVSCVGSIGAVALAHPEHQGFNIARAVARVPIDYERADRVYVSEYMKKAETQAYFKSETRTVAQPTLIIKQLCETPISVPPLNLQRAFAARVAEIDALKAHHRAHLAQLDALFASLQHRAFREEL